MSTSSVGVDGHGNTSEQHASHKSQHSAWFSGLALKPFIERRTRQAEIEEANGCGHVQPQILHNFSCQRASLLPPVLSDSCSGSKADSCCVLLPANFKLHHVSGPGQS